MNQPGLPLSMRVVVRDWLNANHVLFLGEENVLVDTGYGCCFEQTLAALTPHLGAAQLHRIVNTHGHSDHIGGNAALQRLYGCTITIPEGEAELIASWDTRGLWLDYCDQQVERFAYDHLVRPGETLFLGNLSWQAIAAPGHDMGALLFHCREEGLLISGDALWENGFGVIMPGPGVENRLAEARATLDTIASLDVRLIIPGHGEPFTETGPALERAFARVRAFEADPVRMAKNCVRVMLVYSLMHRGRLLLTELPEYLQRVPVHRELNDLYFRLPPAQFAETLVADLEKAGAARREGGYLVAAAGGE